METLYRFGRQVVDALNENEVKAPEGKYFGGIVVMAAEVNNREQPPLAGSLNYDKLTGKWVWTDQLDQATRVADNNERG